MILFCDKERCENNKECRCTLTIVQINKSGECENCKIKEGE